jgi:starch phosphorylase
MFTLGVVPFTQYRHQCNPELSALITRTLKLEKSVWLKDLTKLEGLLEFVDDKKFQTEWGQIKQRNKERLAHHVEKTLGVKINTRAMFDVHIKVCSAPFDVFDDDSSSTP